jgi:uncharacterized Zn finger protein
VGRRKATGRRVDMTRVDDWFDEQTLLDLVPADVYLRGASAVEAGAVRILERGDARLLTTVEAVDIVEVEWSLSGDQLMYSCTCGQAVEHPCEHLIASALATWPGEMPDQAAD